MNFYNYKKVFENGNFKEIIDNLHDEIMVFDNDYTLVYINKASYRHYGVSPDSMIGQKFEDLDGTYWGPSTLPIVYKTKKMVALKQITNLGADVLTVSVPIFDEQGEIKYVAMSVNDLDSINKLAHNQYRFIEDGKDEKKILDSDENLIYQSEQMKQIIRLSKKISKVKSPCLILGETGTGKSLLAKYIHSKSNRRHKPFMNINCASISHNLIESELFGYSKGAFSGANKEGKKGLIELANGGTLFLDEISEIPVSLQAKLLQVIQEEQFIPIGGQKTIKVDIRVIAATNCNLLQMIDLGTFRRDLYFRLNVFEIEIPPLKERNEDVIALTYYYLNLFNKEYKRNHTISNEAINIIANYSWPGNIRELAHTIEKLVVIVEDIEITAYHLPKHLYSFEKPKTIINTDNKSLDEMKEELEKQIITKTYSKYKNSVKVAQELKISQPKAYRLIKKYIGT